MTQTHRRGQITLHRTIGGTCRVCVEPILKPNGTPATRKTWHPECLERYWLHTHPGETRRIVFRRDQGRCRNCGHIESTLFGHWEADHIVPLIDGGSFELSNLQTLCTPCHKAKTAREASARARLRRQNRDALLGVQDLFEPELLDRHPEEPGQPMGLDHVGDGLAALPADVGHAVDAKGAGHGLLGEAVPLEFPLGLADRLDVARHPADGSTLATSPLHGELTGCSRMATLCI